MRRFRRITVLAASLAVAATLLLGGWLWRAKGTENRPAFLAFEGVCQEFYRRHGVWPRTFAEAMGAADPGEKSIVSAAVRDAALEVGLRSGPESLSVTYTGRSLLGPFVHRSLVRRP